jgi:hypothetical protein
VVRDPVREDAVDESSRARARGGRGRGRARGVKGEVDLSRGEVREKRGGDRPQRQRPHECLKDHQRESPSQRREEQQQSLTPEAAEATRSARSPLGDDGHGESRAGELLFRVSLERIDILLELSLRSAEDSSIWRPWHRRCLPSRTAQEERRIRGKRGGMERGGTCIVSVVMMTGASP